MSGMLNSQKMYTPTITTSRLSLRSFTLEDTDALHQILGVKGVLQYFPTPDPPERDLVEKLLAPVADPPSFLVADQQAPAPGQGETVGDTDHPFRRSQEVSDARRSVGR